MNRSLLRALALALLAALGFFLTACDSGKPTDRSARTPAASITPKPQDTKEVGRQSTDPDIVNGLVNPCSLEPINELKRIVDKRLRLSPKDKYYVDNKTTRYCTYDGFGFGPQVTIAVFDGESVNRPNVQSGCAVVKDPVQRSKPGCNVYTFNPDLYSLNGIHGDTGVSETWFTYTMYAANPADPTKSNARLTFRFDTMVVDLSIAEGTTAQLLDIGHDLTSSLRQQLRK